MADLIAQGQLSLRAATEIAEKHSKGVALEVRCDLQGTPGERAGNPEPQRTPSASDRLVYSVSCFAKERVETIRVDGQTKKVMEMPGSGNDEK